MGEPKLEWSTIQLCMANQQNIIPLGRLSKIMVDIAGVKVWADFKVIRIVEDADPYLALIGLYWAIDMDGIINFKKISMVFESEGTQVIVPLDPAEGKRYTEPLWEEEEVDHIYKLTMRDEDWINPMADSVLCREKYSKCSSDSDGEIENWKNQLHDVSALRCQRITRDFHCISLEVRELPYFDGSGSIKEFLQTFKAEFPRERRLWALNLAMRATPARLWDMHKEAFQDWEECRDMMILRFEPLVEVRFKTLLVPGDLREHFFDWMEKWYDRTTEEWVHFFIHALGPIPTTWYLDAELHQRTHHWETLKDEFIVTFGLTGGSEALDEAL